MIIIDNALNKRELENNPIRVGLIGAGFMAKGIVNQIVNYVPGLKVSAIANRTPSNALNVYKLAGISDAIEIDSAIELDDAISKGLYAYTQNSDAICESEKIDVLIESTGRY